MRIVRSDAQLVSRGYGRVLDFDIESRPLGWYGGDWVHQEVTAIGSAFVDDPEGTMEVFVITKRSGSERRMLKRFRKRLAEAGMVVGHYIRGYDLPQLNAAMLEFQFPPLDPIWTHDTKGDLLRFQGVSKSQKNLSDLLGLSKPKFDMSVPDWREANRLERKGIAKTKVRVASDVIQNIEMYEELMRREWLKEPRLWTPGSGSVKGYRP